MTRKHYYGSRPHGLSYKAQVYHYDETGNKVIVVWQSSSIYGSREEAVDAAAEWLEDHPEIEAELDG